MCLLMIMHRDCARRQNLKINYQNISMVCLAVGSMNVLEKSSVFGANNNSDLLTDADRRLLNLRNRILRVVMSPNLKIDESKCDLKQRIT